jgi:hypothetical protein
MTGIGHEKRIMKVQMDRILQSAVVLSWKDLLHVSQKGLIHIDYAPGPSLQHLKIWQLAGTGSWSLICEYWMRQGEAVSPVTGLTFSNDYHSEGLAQMLEVIMQHQGRFMTSFCRSGAGLIQVTPPTEQERRAASACMRDAYDGLGFAFDCIPSTAVA